MDLKLTIVSDGEKGNYVYNWGYVLFELSGVPEDTSEDYSFSLYNDQLALFGYAKTGEFDITRNGSIMEGNLELYRIWLPGKYFMIVRNGHDDIIRFDIELDNHRHFETINVRNCKKLSEEDVLSGRLCHNYIFWAVFSSIGGMRQWKEWLIHRAQQYELNEFRTANDIPAFNFNNNFVMTFKNATSQAGMVASFIKLAEIEGELKGAFLEDFHDVALSNNYERLNEFFEGSPEIFDPFSGNDKFKPKVYCFFQLGHLGNASGKAIASKIRTHWPVPKTSAIFCGNNLSVNNMFEQYPSWKNYIPPKNYLVEEPYTCEEIINCFFNIADAGKYSLTPEAVEKACRLFIKLYHQGIICNWTKKEISLFIKNQLLPNYFNRSVSDVQNECDVSRIIKIQPEDIDERHFAVQTSEFDNALKELNAMVGLDNIKQSIVSHSHRVHFYTIRRQLELPTSENAVYHAVFTGNPGTGKTTVARMLGKIYHSLGILSRGEVVCVDRKKMVGRYVGETEDNMNRILQEARGNVLFVDEAYTLYGSIESNDYGRKAVESLLEILSRKEPDMVVVFAGYKKEMDILMSMNPGLAGRFPYKYHFEDYSDTQLMQIAETIFAKDAYLLTEEANTALHDSITDMLNSHLENFANARWIEQFVRNGIIPAMADRISANMDSITKELCQRVEIADIVAGYEKFNPKALELITHRKVGFNS